MKALEEVIARLQEEVNELLDGVEHDKTQYTLGLAQGIDNAITALQPLLK